jgi:protein-disulfide isomerase
LAGKKKASAAQTSGMKNFYILLAVVAVIGIGAIVYVARSGDADMATAPVDMAQIADATELMERARGVSVGEESAPVQMLVFSDYQCPGCAHWANSIEPMLKNEFVATGVVRLTYFDFPLGGNFRHSFVASRAARCAGDQDRFWEYHDRLMQQQQAWSFSQSTPTGQFLQYGQDLGLDQRQFESCLRSDAHAETVTANRMLGETLGVGGTPTIFLNGRRLGNEWNDYNRVRSAVQAASGT